MYLGFHLTHLLCIFSISDLLWTGILTFDGTDSDIIIFFCLLYNFLVANMTLAQ